MLHKPPCYYSSVQTCFTLLTIFSDLDRQFKKIRERCKQEFRSYLRKDNWTELKQCVCNETMPVDKSFTCTQIYIDKNVGKVDTDSIPVHECIAKNTEQETNHPET